SATDPLGWDKIPVLVSYRLATRTATLSTRGTEAANSRGRRCLRKQAGKTAEAATRSKCGSSAFSRLRPTITIGSSDNAPWGLGVFNAPVTSLSFEFRRLPSIMMHSLNRRRFLTQSAQYAAGLGLAGVLGGPVLAAEEKPLYRISLAQWSLHRTIF